MSLVLNFTEICFDLFDYLYKGTLVISNCLFSVRTFPSLLPDIFLDVFEMTQRKDFHLFPDCFGEVFASFCSDFVSEGKLKKFRPVASRKAFAAFRFDFVAVLV